MDFDIFDGNVTNKLGNQNGSRPNYEFCQTAGPCRIAGILAISK